MPAVPQEVLKITISHEFHQNKDGLRLGHHSDQLHHMFRSEKQKQTLKQTKIKRISLYGPASLHGGRLSKELNTVFESGIIVQGFHSTLHRCTILVYNIRCISSEHKHLGSSHFTCSLSVPL